MKPSKVIGFLACLRLRIQQTQFSGLKLWEVAPEVRYFPPKVRPILPNQSPIKQLKVLTATVALVVKANSVNNILQTM